MAPGAGRATLARRRACARRQRPRQPAHERLRNLCGAPRAAVEPDHVGHPDQVQGLGPGHLLVDAVARAVPGDLLAGLRVVLKNGIPNFVVYLFAGLIVWNMFRPSLVDRDRGDRRPGGAGEEGLVSRARSSRCPTWARRSSTSSSSSCVFGALSRWSSATRRTWALLLAAARSSFVALYLLHRVGGDRHVGGHRVPARHGAPHGRHAPAVVLADPGRLLLRALHLAAAAARSRPGRGCTSSTRSR